MDLLLLVVLIGLNGLFSMAEIAVLSSREVRLQKLAGERRRGANSALILKNNPAAFLSTVQVGITMVGILSGAVGENALVGPLTQWLSLLPLPAAGQPLALGLVVVGLTYVTVVIGELVPKHLGLLNPEWLATLVARPMRLLARIAKPLVWLLTASSHGLLRLLGAHSRDEGGVSNEEIRLMMEQGARAGVFHESEQQLVANVLRLDELPVEAIMTHRQEVQLLDLNWPEADIRRYLATCGHSRVIVCRGGWGEIAGLLRTADLLEAALACAPLEIDRHLRPPLYVPEHVTTTTHLLEHFRKAQLQCALVVDEYGDIQGLVTLTDVLTAIVGEVPSSQLTEEHAIIQREDGSWLIDGTPMERVKSLLGLKDALPGEQGRVYHSMAGFVIHMLGRIPAESDHFEVQGHRFEVIDMDHHRIDKVLVVAQPDLPPSSD